MPEGGLTSVMRELGERAGITTGERRRAAMKLRAPEDAGILAKRRVEAARAPFEMAGYGKPKPFEIVQSSFSEQPRGAALDLNALGAWDLAHYQPLERKNPTKVSERAKTAFSPENTREFERYVRQGVREGGTEWYDMSPLSRVALQEMSPEDFRVLMAMNAATSARSAVTDQIKRASLAWYYRKQGIPWPMDNKELIESAGEGYGHLAHDIHSKHLAPLVAGESPNFSSIDQPKYASYFSNFTGNLAPLTADTHYQALHGFPMKESYNKFSKKWIESPDFSKNVDYPFAEAFSSERARRMGLPPAAYQSAAWVGGKEATGVRDARPFSAVYDDLIARTAQQMDISPTEALKKHLRGELPLAPIERAGGGAVPSLERYIRSRLPGKYAAMPMRHLQRPPVSLEDVDNPERYAGSSRDIYALGDDKLVKLAKRPRGLFEMSLEGHPQLSKHLPGLDWRSPDNELAVVERMPLTPDASKAFMGPMQARYKQIPHYRMPHVDDRELSAMMSERGLDDFKGYRIHGPDFFNAPEHHWAMRAPRGISPENAMDAFKARPTLLDPGALDSRITNPHFEQSHARSFHDVISNRLEAMGRRPKPEEMIEQALAEGDMGHLNPYGIAKGNEQFFGPHALFPPLPRAQDLPTDDLTDLARMMLPRGGPSVDISQKTFGFSRGGPVDLKFTAMRQRLAGGGVVRNWLRGVKGSKFDKVLGDLKKRYAPEKHEDIMPGDEAHYAEQLEREKHMGKWIDTNLANYMAKQMGTPGDPLMDMPIYDAERFMGGERGMQPVRGRQFLDRIVREMAPGEVPKNYIPDVDQNRFYSGRRETAKKKLEENARAAAEMTQRQRQQFVEEMPAWLRKHYDEDALRQQFKPNLKPSTLLHDLDESVWNTNMADPMRGVLDWMKQQTEFPPERLSRVSVPQAFTAARQWHEQLAKKAEEQKLKALAGGPWLATHKEYPTGFKWVKYNPDYVPNDETAGRLGIKTKVRGEGTEHEQFANALKAEGDAMGHCVGGYCDDVLDGSTQIYSLRDPKGRPHVTVEVSPWKPVAGSNAAAKREALPNPDAHDIVQIKGKANRKPNDEYLPYVQDFVRSGKWGTVGDIKNTGLDEIVSSTGKTHYLTQDEAAPFASQWPHTPRDESGILLPGVKKGRYVRGDNFVDYNIPDDFTPPPIGFAAGGMVQAADFPRENASEALMRARFSLQILLEEQRHATPEERPTLEREIQRVQALIDRLSGAQAQTGVKDVGLPQGRAMSGGDDGDGLDDVSDMLEDMITGDPGMDDFLEQLMGARA